MTTVTRTLRGAAAILTIARPDKLNAINRQVLSDLGEGLQWAESEASARAIILTGQGDKAFAAGADIGEMALLDPETSKEYSLLGQALYGSMRASSKPVLAAVNGYALGGGCELAMSADIRVASENARFGQPETGLGIIPGFGGAGSLVRIAGEAVAMDLIITGRIIGADEAARLGLVHRVVPAGAALEEALKIAEEIALRSPHATALAKRAIVANTDSREIQEAELFSQCFTHKDKDEGFSAFLEKRKPSFQP